MSKNKGSKSVEHDPSNDVDTTSNMITCSFQITKEQMVDIDIVKLNATSCWSYEEKDGRHWAKGKVLSDFDSQYNRIIEEGGEYLENLVKRSYNIDIQRDERERVKQSLGLVKQSTRVTLVNYKAGILEKLMASGMSEVDAMKIINS